MKKDVVKFLPLAPPTLHILLVLAGKDLHGYGIMQEVARESEGQYKLGPGTLYDNLQRLLDQGLVSEVARREEDDPRRRYYRLTTSGRRAVTEEISRLEAVFRQAKAHLRPVKAGKI